MKTLSALSALSALTLTLALAGTAAAQDGQRPSADPDVTYDFGDDRVDGEYRQPLGEILNVRGRHGRSTLVQPRPHYVPELLKSVESI